MEGVNEMFKFEEKQGRLCIRLDLYLELDFDNKDLEKVFNEMDIQIKHPLLTGDYEIKAITE